MPFLSLPNELLVHIAQYLEYVDEVNAFSQTCRLPYSLVNPLLFPHVHQRQVEAMMHAMKTGDHVLIKRLIEAGITAELYVHTTHHGALQIAADQGHTGIVRVLLDLNQGVLNIEATYNKAPLVCAILNRHFDTARLMISRSVDPNYAEEITLLGGGRTPLSYAAKQGSLEGVRFLIEEVTSGLDFRDAKGWTPLFYAASNGFLDAVKLLLSVGADPRVRDNEGKTILFHVAQRNHEQTVLFLLEIPRDTRNTCSTNWMEFPSLI